MSGKAFPLEQERFLRNVRDGARRKLIQIRWSYFDHQDSKKRTEIFTGGKYYDHCELEDDVFGPAPTCYGLSSELRQQMIELTNGAVDPDSLVGTEVFTIPRPEGQKSEAHVAYNFCNAKQGVMFCHHNDKSRSMLKIVRPQIDLPNSEIIWQQWKYHCKQEGVDESELRWIWRNNIENQKTLDILELVAPESEGTQVFRHRVTSERAGFEALLGSPNGNGVAYLVADHRKTLLQKRIVSCTVHYAFATPESCKKMPMLLFELA